MSKLSWLIGGVVLGFIGAHFVNQTPGGRRFFEQLNQGVREFGEAVAEGYHDAEDEFDDMFDDVKRQLDSLKAKN